MPVSKADIIAHLQKNILLQQARPVLRSADNAIDLGPINASFPLGSFPTGAIHEFCCATPESASASAGFIAGITGRLMRTGGACVWIGPRQNIFPQALAAFGIPPEKVIFIHLPKEKDQLWAMEEALKCSGLAAVVAEVPDLSFMASRRLQLATEQSRVTGFILRTGNRAMGTNACSGRWKITSAPGLPQEWLPGLGFPRWKVELLRVRNGKPGVWLMEWAAGRLSEVAVLCEIEYQRKAV